MNYIYDIEIFPNYFLVSFIDINAKGVDEYIKADINNDLVAKKKALAKINPKVFSIFEEVNDLKALISFLNDKNTVILIGFNNFNYDDFIDNYSQLLEKCRK